MVDSAVRLAKRLVDYPEGAPRTVSSTEWLKSGATHPFQKVGRSTLNPTTLQRQMLIFDLPQIRNYVVSLFPILSWMPRYSK